MTGEQPAGDHRVEGMLALLAGSSAASRMARRLLAASILVPVVLGGLRLWGQRAGLYGTEVGTALFAAGNALAFAWLISRSALAVHRHEQRRRQAEAHLRETNADLELWVAERTRALAEVNGALRRQMLELKRAQEAMVKARDTAEQAMRARSDFLARMSHEIRTPMNGVIGMTELALQTVLTPEQREYLESARSSARSLLGLINDVLDFSKIDAGKLRLHRVPFRPRDSIGAGLRALGGQAHGKGLELILDVDPQVPAGLIGDPERLQQVITNLVGNAVKFTDRGEVAVKVSLLEAGADHATLQVEVADTGIGIPADRLTAVFDSFVQADDSTTRRFGGTGLGLAICAQLVELMQGQIRVESELGRGSRFIFTASVRARSRRRASRPAPPPIWPACRCCWWTITRASARWSGACWPAGRCGWWPAMPRGRWRRPGRRARPATPSACCCWTRACPGRTSWCWPGGCASWVRPARAWCCCPAAGTSRSRDARRCWAPMPRWPNR